MASSSSGKGKRKDEEPTGNETAAKKRDTNLKDGRGPVKEQDGFGPVVKKKEEQEDVKKFVAKKESPKQSYIGTSHFFKRHKPRP